MPELTSLSASELAQLIRTKAVSPVEVIEQHLQRIQELNPKLNAVVTIAPDALELARQAENAVKRGESAGPLHGVPLTVKDTIETAGLLSTSGSQTRAKFIPRNDAAAVARLKSAGAIVLGKTNAAEMAMEYTADNPVFGRTNHPDNKNLTPGGSSGGEAVAIATGMSPAGIGSDLAGSVRIPAHLCGICALKPGTGRVPDGGQFPPGAGPYSLGSVIGPMARSVADLELLFSSLCEGETGKAGNLRGTRAAWYADDNVAPVTVETRAAVKTAASLLSHAGLMVEEARPPGIEHGHDLWLKLFSRASVLQLRKVYQGQEDKGGAFVRWRLATADERPVPTLDEYIEAWMERDRLREELLRWMASVPILVAPVGATNAIEHDTIKLTVAGVTMSAFRAFSYSQAFNLFDLPAAVVKVGTANGLPIGVQVIGLPRQEMTVLAAAKIIEAGADA